MRKLLYVITAVMYWLPAAYLILGARGHRDDDVFAWIFATPFTAPIGLLSYVTQVDQEWKRAWFTFWTTTGALTNGLVLAWLVTRVYRYVQRVVTSEIRQEYGDYDVPGR